MVAGGKYRNMGLGIVHGLHWKLNYDRDGHMPDLHKIAIKVLQNTSALFCVVRAAQTMIEGIG